MTEKNAIERELTKLEEQWQAFQETDRAILHWMIKTGDQQLSHVFVTLKEQFDEQEPDLFVQLKAPFTHAQEFGWALAKELNQRVAEGMQDADADPESTPADNQPAWQAPDLKECQSGFHALFASCDALLAMFDDVLDYLVLVIAPTCIADVEEYQKWWSTACMVKSRYQVWHEKIQWVVFDVVEQPLLSTIFEEHDSWAVTLVAPVDVQAALKDVAQEADDGSDGAQLRLHLLDMNEAIAAGDYKRLEQASLLALVIAEHNQWLDVWATLLMTRAAGWLNAKEHERAFQDYRQAQDMATQGLKEGTPGCDKLLLQAMLCEGTTLFMADHLDRAAQSYEKTALKAQELDDKWLAIEAWRMASFSQERLNNKHEAWNFANQAFNIGREMTQEERELSTLAFVGQALLRVSPNQHVKNEVNALFKHWLGGDWLQKLESATA